MHKPIQITDLSLSFSHKTCFADFNTQISYGSRIAIIGRNGSGKSTLLNLLQKKIIASSGEIKIPTDVIFAYVPQVIEQFETLSGGQRLNEMLTAALSIEPNVLLLDEPTNHLDRNNRKSLLRMLQTYTGTLIVVSHDMELLRHNVDTLWHIDNEKITIFSGNYDDYMREINTQRVCLEQQLLQLDRQKKMTHQALMQEQKRAAKSRAKGAKSISQRKWPTIVSNAKAVRGEQTSGRKKSAIENKKQELIDQLADLRLPEIIVPTFSLTSNDVGKHTVLSIHNGSITYDAQHIILANIHLSLNARQRIAITGNNGSGKSTLVKAILNDASILKTGDWLVPKIENIGYLDQHYNTFSNEHTVIESIEKIVPTWSHADIRRHLNDFLFRKNEEVNARCKQLSGGEKARLSLAQIAANTPRLLILDEVTNNLDLETREYVINVISAYPGAIIIISHDENFLNDLGIEEYYHLDVKNLAREWN